MPLKIKNAIFYTTSFVFCCMNFLFPAYDFSWKLYVLGGVFSALVAMVVMFYDIPWLRNQVIGAFTSTEIRPLKSYSERISRCSWIIFMMAMLALNFNAIWLARIMLVIFLLLVIFCLFLTYLDLQQHSDIFNRMLKFIYVVIVPVVYVVSNGYIASHFLVSSGMKIDDSPLIQLWLSWAYFAVWMLPVIQVFSIIVCFVLYKVRNIGNILNTSTIMIGIYFFVIIFTGWFNNFQVLILDYATGEEWVKEFSCGNIKATNYNVRYFQQDDDKYVAYFSDRGGKWGFDKVRCVTDANGIGVITSTTVDVISNRGWFQDKK